MVLQKAIPLAARAIDSTLPLEMIWAGRDTGSSQSCLSAVVVQIKMFPLFSCRATRSLPSSSITISMAYWLSGSHRFSSTYRPVAAVLIEGIRAISSASAFFSFPQPAKLPITRTTISRADNIRFIFMCRSSLLKMEPV